jgi:hypothetical protein
MKAAEATDTAVRDTAASARSAAAAAATARRMCGFYHWRVQAV